MQVFLRSHDQHSEGARRLAEALEIPRLRHHLSRFRPHHSKLLINWGASQLPQELLVCRVINDPTFVDMASNKRTFFRALSSMPEIATVPFTSDKTKAVEWLSQGHTVCARQKLNASGGEGLVLFDHTDKFVDAPLWTLYVKKRDEFRIHVMAGEIIAVQRKALKNDFEGETDHRVRNLANGYIFARNEVDPPKMILEQSLLCVGRLGLDFGAVDILWNEKKQQSYILEVNTAPGLEGTTVDDYANSFRRKFFTDTP